MGLGLTMRLVLRGLGVEYLGLRFSAFKVRVMLDI